MKKVIFALVLMLMVSGAVLGNTLNKLGDTMLSNSWTIYRTTMPAANTIYRVTLEAGTVVDIDIQAIGGDIIWPAGGTTTETTYRTIKENASFKTNVPLQLAVDTVLKFYTASTATPEVQVYLNYR